MLDYKDLLEKEQQQQETLGLRVPSRPTTAASMVRSGGSATYLNRKSKQHKLLAMQASQEKSGNNRPHTSSARLRPANSVPASPRPMQVLQTPTTESGDKNGVLRTPRRAQTAGAAMKKKEPPPVANAQAPVPPEAREEDALSVLDSDPRSISSTSIDQGDVFFFPVVSSDRN